MAATKCDLPVRKVFEKEGREWATAHGFPFFEVGHTAAIAHVSNKAGCAYDCLPSYLCLA